MRIGDYLCPWHPGMTLSQCHEMHAATPPQSGGYTAEDRERWRAEILEAKQTKTPDEFAAWLKRRMNTVGGSTQAEGGPRDLTIPIRRRDDPPTGAELEARLRRMGWDDEKLTPDMLACLDDIAAGLREMREADDAQDHAE